MKHFRLQPIMVVLSLLLSLWFTSCQTPDDPQDPIEDPQIIENTSTEEFVVTEEIYTTTFNEIETLIEELNSIISQRKFTLWKSYLSNSYIEKHSDEEELEIMSQSPILMDNGIVLRSLEDFFQYIVVPSRSNTVLDDIEFQTETQITVWSIFNGNRVKLYQLEKIDDNWKISVW